MERSIRDEADELLQDHQTIAFDNTLTRIYTIRVPIDSPIGVKAGLLKGIHRLESVLRHEREKILGL